LTRANELLRKLYRYGRFKDHAGCRHTILSLSGSKRIAVRSLVRNYVYVLTFALENFPFLETSGRSSNRSVGLVLIVWVKLFFTFQLTKDFLHENVPFHSWYRNKTSVIWTIQ
jgi:hypothetical protein